MNLNNVDLLQLMTKYMQQDKTTQGLCEALSPKLREIAAEIIHACLYLNLDSIFDKWILENGYWDDAGTWHDTEEWNEETAGPFSSVPESIIDELARQFHTDFYDADVSVEVKRQLVQDSMSIHRKKGTPYAVKKLISDVFGDAELKEWFQYSGDPYTFRVAVDYSPEVAAEITRLHSLIEVAKNARSKLEAIELTMRSRLGILQEIYKTDLTRHTKLGVWRLGLDPFATVGSEVQIK